MSAVGADHDLRALRHAGRFEWPLIPTTRPSSIRDLLDGEVLWDLHARFGRALLHLLERPSDRRPVRNVHQALPRVCGRAYERWTDAHGLRMAIHEFEANKKDVERHFLALFELVPEFAARMRGARREAPIAGTAVANYLRKPYGPGWVLVGDAGYSRDPITAQGINDAFRDAERCATALDQTLSGQHSFADAMGAYHRERDESVLPMYEFTCQLATLEPPPPEMQQMLGAIHGHQRAMDAFVQMNAGTISPAQFGEAVAGAQP